VHSRQAKRVSKKRPLQSSSWFALRAIFSHRIPMNQDTLLSRRRSRATSFLSWASFSTRLGSGRGKSSEKHLASCRDGQPAADHLLGRPPLGHPRHRAEHEVKVVTITPSGTRCRWRTGSQLFFPVDDPVAAMREVLAGLRGRVRTGTRAAHSGSSNGRQLGVRRPAVYDEHTTPWQQSFHVVADHGPPQYPARHASAQE